ncbi:MAG: metallophosphoesterase [Alphaproteobacteria bacterium]|nr:metallophosphoesterase [Alphaproteobacteria bacterium]
MYFIIAGVVIALACTVITVRTLVSYSDIRLPGKLVIGFMVAYGWFAPFIIAGVKKYALLSSEIYNLFAPVSYFLFGTAFLLFSLLLFRDVLWYLLYGIVRIFDRTNWVLNPKNLNVLGKVNLITVGLTIVLAAYAFYEGVKEPEIRDIYITSNRIHKNVTMLQLTDLHINRTTSVDDIDKLVNRVNSLRPDFIVLTGDIVDDKVDVLTAQTNALAKLKAPYGVYISFGNHELYNGIASWQKRFEEMGFHLLFNKGLPVGDTNIYLAGIPDSHTASMSPMLNVNFYKALKGSKKTQYKVLMSHTPDFVDYLSSRIIDLQLSGHTHGGQIFPFHLLVKKANKYLAGLYDVRGLKLYVSRGVGSWGPPMRLFAPAEITLISLLPED